MKQSSLFISIKSKSDITKVFDQGTKLYTGNLLIRVIPNPGRSKRLPLQVLIAAPKKKLGAVGRNRLKRICKSALFQAMKNRIGDMEKTLPTSYDVIVHAREELNELPESDRILEFEALLARLLKLSQTQLKNQNIN